jgi:hypothetical protein
VKAWCWFFSTFLSRRTLAVIVENPLIRMTQQIRDKLFYDGKEYFLNNEILEYYFNKFPEKKPKSNSMWTACWRGYCATFEIIKNELIIKEFGLLDWFENDKEEKPQVELFPNNKYSWFTGFIRIDDFRGKYDDENNEEGIYELLEFKNGDLVNHWKLNYIDFMTFKEILFENYKETSSYTETVMKWKKNNPKMKHTEIDKYIFEYIINNVSR